MVGEDSMETPYGYEEYEEYTWKSTALKIGKIILAIAVVVAIGWFVYDYFIGSYIDVEINIKDTEGGMIKDNEIFIRDGTGSTEIFSDDGLATYSEKIKRGEYRIKVEAPGYQEFDDKETFSDEKKEIIIELEKDMDIKLKTISMPPQVFANQEFFVSLSVENDDRKSAEVEFEFEADLEKYQCKPVENKMIAPGKTTSDFNFTCTVPADPDIGRSKTGKSKEGRVSVLFINESEDQEFLVFPKPDVDYPNRVKFNNLSPASESKAQEIFEIENDSKFDLRFVDLKINITSAEKNGAEEVAEWIYFTNAESGDRSHKFIDRIAEKMDYKEPIEVNLPITAKEETIYGNIVVSAPFLESPVIIPLEIEIAESAEAKISLGYPESVTISFSDGAPRDEQKIITVNNDSELAIEDVEIEVQNSVECSEFWLSFVGAHSFSRIGAKENKDVYVTFSTPSTASEGQYEDCILLVSYIDPVTDSLVEEQGGIINVKRS